MEERVLTEEHLHLFSEYLLREEKSKATCEKYLRDAGAFARYAAGRTVDKELVIDWKRELQEQRYAVRSINSMLASVNSLLEFLGWQGC